MCNYKNKLSDTHEHTYTNKKIMTKTQKGVSKNCTDFRMYLNLSKHQLKIDCYEHNFLYMKQMGNHKKKSTRYIQEINRKEPIHSNTESHRHTREESKRPSPRWKEGQGHIIKHAGPECAHLWETRQPHTHSPPAVNSGAVLIHHIHFYRNGCSSTRQAPVKIPCLFPGILHTR